MKQTLCVLLVSFLLTPPTFAQNCKEIIGYYPAWQWYDRDKLVNPQTIDYSNYTIINYAFFAPDAKGFISGTDSWADENILLGENDWVNGGYIPNTSLIDNAHRNGVKVLVSIGGWTLSNNFPAIAADPVKRTTFASECVRLLQTYRFDGIDIDWEYPGYAEHNGGPADKANFTLLLDAIRKAIDDYGVEVGKQFLLTAAVGASASNASYIEWEQVQEILDMINLMSYDFFGSWSTEGNHNAPLYASTAGDPSFNVDAAFRLLTETHGVEANKINLGVAFYGRSLTNCDQLFCTGHAAATDAAIYSNDEGIPLYFNILNNMSQFTRHWDDRAKVPYLLGNNRKTFVSYDDEESIALKAQYVKEKGAKGVIIWEITGDYIESSPGSGDIIGTPLADVLTDAFCTNINTAIPQAEQGSTGFILDPVYPNPISKDKELHLSFQLNKAATLEIKLSDLVGKDLIIHSQKTLLPGKYSEVLTVPPSGLYLLHVQAGNEIGSQKVIVY